VVKARDAVSAHTAVLGARGPRGLARRARAAALGEEDVVERVGGRERARVFPRDDARVGVARGREGGGAAREQHPRLAAVARGKVRVATAEQPRLLAAVGEAVHGERAKRAAEDAHVEELHDRVAPVHEGVRQPARAAHDPLHAHPPRGRPREARRGRRGARARAALGRARA
jgi:hypothetical protein